MKTDKLDQILMMAWFIMANQQTSVILQIVCAFFGSCYAVLSSYRIVRSWFSPHNAEVSHGDRERQPDADQPSEQP